MRISHPSFRTAGVALAGLVALVALSAASCQRHGVINGGGTLTSTAGTVDVQCVDGNEVKITGFNPAPGYTGKIIVAGPSGEASLRFSNPNANDWNVAVFCENSQATLVQFEIKDKTLS
jgi:hypothetical protein